MNPPVTYIEDFVADPDPALLELQEDLDWERRGDTPRMEYYCGPHPYMYGKGVGRRQYDPKPWHPIIAALRAKLEDRVTPGSATRVALDVCFLNRYLDQRDHLGWHADDSPEMDDSKPIGVVSLGVPREIWFQRRQTGSGEPPQVYKQLLGHGSLLLMHPGMQDDWRHRIPKASFQCGERVSLTFRGYDYVGALAAENQRLGLY